MCLKLDPYAEKDIKQNMTDTGLLCYTSLVQDGRQSSWVNGTGYLDISCILNQNMTEQNTIQLTKVEIILIKL